MVARRVALLLVAAMVVVAGCSGGGPSPATPSETNTTTAIPTDTTTNETNVTKNETNATTAMAGATTTVAPTNDTLAPGVNTTGVEDSEALVTAHLESLNESGFAFRFQANVSVGPASQLTRQSGVVESGLSPLVVHSSSTRRFENGSTRVATDLWANQTTAVVRYDRENRSQLRVFDRAGGDLSDETWAHLPRADLESQVTQAWLLELALSAGEYELAGTDRRDGRRVAVLRATEPVAATNFTDLNATVVVDLDGRVRELSLTAAYEDDGASIHYEFELTEVGSVSVSRTSWVGAAIPPNRTAGNATTTMATTMTTGTATTTAENTTTTTNETTATTTD